MGVQITWEAVWKSKGYLGLMTRTYQHEVVCSIEKRVGKYTEVHDCIIFPLADPGAPITDVFNHLKGTPSRDLPSSGSRYNICFVYTLKYVTVYGNLPACGIF